MFGVQGPGFKVQGSGFRVLPSAPSTSAASPSTALSPDALVPLSSQLGTNKPAKAGFWPWLELFAMRTSVQPGLAVCRFEVETCKPFEVFPP